MKDGQFKNFMGYRECPRCKRSGVFKVIGGKRPGLECPNCGIFFPSETWESKDGTLVRRYPKAKPRKTYVAPGVLTGTAYKTHIQDEWDILDPDRVEGDLPDLSEW